VLSRLYDTAFLVLRFLSDRRYPFRSRERVRRDQARRVRRMVEHAYRFVPYYRETLDRLGLSPADFKSAEDLSRLPLLERRQIQSDPERFLSAKGSVGRTERFSTAGSTGKPISVICELSAVFFTAVLGRRYHDCLVAAAAGRRQSGRETWIFRPNDSAVMEYRRLQMDSLQLAAKLLPPRQHLSMLDPPERNIPLLNVFKPDVIHSYGSYLEALFARLQTTGEPFHRPAAVGFGGDGLSDQARRMIRDEFGIPAFSIYGSVEAPSIAFECGEHRGLHINEDAYPVRVVDADGRDLPVGEEGEVVVSNLINRAMVLLNYRQGDLTALLPGPCPCGRTLPLMSFPSGRADDWLEHQSGERVHPAAVYPLFREEEDVLQFQVTQKSPLDFEVCLMTKASCRRPEMEARLRAGFSRIFGNGVSLRISFVSSVPRTPSGKVKAVHVLRNVGDGSEQ